MNGPCRECEGCVLYEQMDTSGKLCLALNYFRLHRLENTCPCINCLVKVTCKNTCEERADFGEEKEGYFEEGQTLVKFEVLRELLNDRCM